MPTIKPIDTPWLDQVKESALEPKRRIVDPHHHLWVRADIGNYALDELWADTGSGHNVEKTVFVECGSSYRTVGPEHLRCVGETDFVAQIAAASAKDGRDPHGVGRSSPVSSRTRISRVATCSKTYCAHTTTRAAACFAAFATPARAIRIRKI